MRIYCFDHQHKTIHRDGVATPLDHDEFDELNKALAAKEALTLVPIADGVAVCRIPKVLNQRVKERYEWTRIFEDEALRALGVLHHRESMKFHPTTGQSLTHSDEDLAARTEDGKQVFPRINPSVIGTIELHKQGQSPRLLLGRNAMRPEYFSLVAGYVEVGESFEQAFAREAMEEAGIRIHNIEYVESQAWPFTGSVMIGMRATTTDENPVEGTDGELLETIWATPADVLGGRYNLPRPGSISLKLILQWAEAHHENP